MKKFQRGDLKNLIPKERFTDLINSGDIEIDVDFLCFEENYIPIANNIPKDFTIVDCGCYVATQSYFFTEHDKYIGIDVFDKNQSKSIYDYQPPQRLITENSQHFKMSIREFLDSEDFKKLDLNKTYFIASAVPAFEQTRELFDSVKNCSVFYPGENSLYKGVSKNAIKKERDNLIKENLSKEKMSESLKNLYPDTFKNNPANYKYSKIFYPQDNFNGKIDASKINEVRNVSGFLPKPYGGLWLSIDNGWENWTEKNYPEMSETAGKRYEVKLSPTANILVIDNIEDVSNLPKIKNLKLEFPRIVALDFEELAKQYDGLAILIDHDKSDAKKTSLYNAFLGWDCDSMVVFNSNIIEDIKLSPSRTLEPGGRF